jgi:hypothetical protein
MAAMTIDLSIDFHRDRVGNLQQFKSVGANNHLFLELVCRALRRPLNHSSCSISSSAPPSAPSGASSGRRPAFLGFLAPVVFRQRLTGGRR